MIYHVADGVYEISLAWSNAYLLMEGSEAALIDTGLRQDRPRLLAALQQLGAREERLRAIYLTHAHCDHAGNAAYFAGRALASEEEQSVNRNRAAVYAHGAEAPYLSLPRRTYAPEGIDAWRRPLTTLAFAGGEWLYPVERCGVDAVLADGDVVDAPGGALRVVACPGHTPGHIAYYREKDGLLFSGDALMNIIPIRRVPGLSLPIPFFSDDWEQARQSVRRLVSLRPSMLFAGHGGPLCENTARRLETWFETLQ